MRRYLLVFICVVGFIVISSAFMLPVSFSDEKVPSPVMSIMLGESVGASLFSIHLMRSSLIQAMNQGADFHSAGTLLKDLAHIEQHVKALGPFDTYSDFEELVISGKWLRLSIGDMRASREYYQSMRRSMTSAGKMTLNYIERQLQEHYCPERLSKVIDKGQFGGAIPSLVDLVFGDQDVETLKERVKLKTRHKPIRVEGAEEVDESVPRPNEELRQLVGQHSHYLDMDRDLLMREQALKMHIEGQERGVLKVNDRLAGLNEQVETHKASGKRLDRRIKELVRQKSEYETQIKKAEAQAADAIKMLLPLSEEIAALKAKQEVVGLQRKITKQLKSRKETIKTDLVSDIKELVKNQQLDKKEMVDFPQLSTEGQREMLWSQYQLLESELAERRGRTAKLKFVGVVSNLHDGVDVLKPMEESDQVSEQLEGLCRQRQELSDRKERYKDEVGEYKFQVERMEATIVQYDKERLSLVQRREKSEQALSQIEDELHGIGEKGLEYLRQVKERGEGACPMNLQELDLLVKRVVEEKKQGIEPLERSIESIELELPLLDRAIQDLREKVKSRKTAHDACIDCTAEIIRLQENLNQEIDAVESKFIRLKEHLESDAQGNEKKTSSQESTLSTMLKSLSLTDMETKGEVLADLVRNLGQKIQLEHGLEVITQTLAVQQREFRSLIFDIDHKAGQLEQLRIESDRAEEIARLKREMRTLSETEDSLLMQQSDLQSVDSLQKGIDELLADQYVKQQTRNQMEKEFGHLANQRNRLREDIQNNWALIRALAEEGNQARAVPRTAEMDDQDWGASVSKWVVTHLEWVPVVNQYFLKGLAAWHGSTSVCYSIMGLYKGYSAGLNFEKAIDSLAKTRNSFSEHWNGTCPAPEHSIRKEALKYGKNTTTALILHPSANDRPVCPAPQSCKKNEAFSRQSPVGANQQPVLPGKSSRTADTALMVHPTANLRPVCVLPRDSQRVFENPHWFAGQGDFVVPKSVELQSRKKQRHDSFVEAGSTEAMTGLGPAYRNQLDCKRRLLLYHRAGLREKDDYNSRRPVQHKVVPDSRLPISAPGEPGKTAETDDSALRKAALDPSGKITRERIIRLQLYRRGRLCELQRVCEETELKLDSMERELETRVLGAADDLSAKDSDDDEEAEAYSSVTMKRESGEEIESEESASSDSSVPITDDIVSEVSTLKLALQSQGVKAEFHSLTALNFISGSLSMMVLSGIRHISDSLWHQRITANETFQWFSSPMGETRYIAHENDEQWYSFMQGGSHSGTFESRHWKGSDFSWGTIGFVGNRVLAGVVLSKQKFLVSASESSGRLLSESNQFSGLMSIQDGMWRYNVLAGVGWPEYRYEEAGAFDRFDAFQSQGYISVSYVFSDGWLRGKMTMSPSLELLHMETIRFNHSSGGAYREAVRLVGDHSRVTVVQTGVVLGFDNNSVTRQQHWSLYLGGQQSTGSHSMDYSLSSQARCVKARKGGKSAVITIGMQQTVQKLTYLNVGFTGQWGKGASSSGLTISYQQHF